jgi:hypothetical protein
VNSAYEYTNQPAVLNLTSNSSTGAKRQLDCSFVSIQGKKLTIEIEERTSISAAVSLEYSDAMFLGEVVSATQTTQGVWRTEVKVEHVLTGLQSLMNLRENLLGASRSTRQVSREYAPVCA